jgi:hypothetical protein
VSRRPPPKKKEPPPKRRKRLTVDLDPGLHARFKIACAKRGEQMTDALRRMVEEVAKEAD